MNTYLAVFFCLHGFLLAVLFLNVLYQYAKQRSLYMNAIIRDQQWMVSLSRCRVFLIRSFINFAVALCGELFSLWLLWMGGVFD